MALLRSTILVLVHLIGFSIAPALAFQTSGASLRGVVTSSPDLPAENQIVVLQSGSTRETFTQTTGADGTFRFASLEGGRYFVGVLVGGKLVNRVEVELLPDTPSALDEALVVPTTPEAPNSFVALSDTTENMIVVAPESQAAGDLVVHITGGTPEVPLSGVAVSVVSVGSGSRQTATTDAQGTAVFRRLAPGAYEVFAGSIGDAFATGRAIVVSGAAAPLSLRLVTPLSELIFMRTLSLERGAPQTTAFGRTEAEAAPRLDRDSSSLLEAAAGAIAVGPTALGLIVFDGKGDEQTANRIDGVESSQLVPVPGGDGAAGIPKNFRDFTVALNNNTVGSTGGAFDTTYGPATGAQKDSSSRPKTLGARTEYSGYLFEVLRNDALDSRNFFDTMGKNPLRRNQFGGVLTGPLISSKVQFLASYEGIRSRSVRRIFEAVPSASSWERVPDSVRSLRPAFVGTGAVVVPGGSGSEDFDIVQLDAAIRTNADSGSFWFDAPIRSAPADGGLGWNVTGRFTREASRSEIPESVTGRTQIQRLRFINGFMSLNTGVQDAKAPTRWHTFRIGFHQTRVDVSTSGQLLPGDDSGLSGLSIGKGVPTAGPLALLDEAPFASPGSLAGGNLRGFGRGFQSNPYSVSFAYQAEHFQTGSQNAFKYGAEVRLLRARYNRLGGLLYAFADFDGFVRNKPTVTFLSDLSEPSVFNEDAAGSRRAAQEYYSAYLQHQYTFREFLGRDYPDEEKPRPVLTYGMRYDYFSVLREAEDRAVVVDPASGEILPRGTRFYERSPYNFQPRVALSVPIHGGPLDRFTFSAAFGLYTGPTAFWDLLQLIDSDRIATGERDLAFPTRPSTVINDFVTQPDNRLYQPLAFGRDYTAVERAYKWDVKVERSMERFGGGRIGLAYSGNRGRNLPLVRLGNPITEVATNDTPTSAAVVVRQFDIIRGTTQFRPFGEFFYRTNGGRSTYDALSVSLDHKTSDGNSILRDDSLNITYTYGRNLGNTSAALPNDPLDPDSDWGYNLADVRHRLTSRATYTLYDLGVGQVRSRTHPFWGTIIALKITAESGRPINVVIDRPDVLYADADGNLFRKPRAGRVAVANLTGGGATAGTSRPDLVPGVSPYLEQDRMLLNPAAFAIPAPGTIGNLRRGDLRLPPTFVMDLGVTKNIGPMLEYGDQPLLELKVDLLNVLNNVRYTGAVVRLPNAIGVREEVNRFQPGQGFAREASKAFGILNTADPGRQIQVTLILNFGKRLSKVEPTR